MFKNPLFLVCVTVKVYLPLDFDILCIQCSLLVKTLIVPLQCHSEEKQHKFIRL